MPCLIVCKWCCPKPGPGFCSLTQWAPVSHSATKVFFRKFSERVLTTRCQCHFATVYLTLSASFMTLSYFPFILCSSKPHSCVCICVRAWAHTLLLSISVSFRLDVRIHVHVCAICLLDLHKRGGNIYTLENYCAI